MERDEEGGHDLSALDRTIARLPRGSLRSRGSMSWARTEGLADGRHLELEHFLHMPDESVNKKPLLTEAEAADFLRVAREAILRFKRDGVDPIPCFKAGRRYLYEPAEVLRCAKRQAVRKQKKYLRSY